MLDKQEQLPILEEPSQPAGAPLEAGWLLTRLEVYNWGPFQGMHRAEFDPHGTAIIGPTGSGKTTLVDALMTLLVNQPRYNLASTGGHESDRTLIDYVRGVLGGDGSDGRQQVARPGKTITGICATYLGGEGTLRLGALFWTDGVSNSADDLKRRWLFSLAADQSLEKWLTLLHEDGTRELMKFGRETSSLRIFHSKKGYLTHARKFFDVSENAFTLLNRAAGLKQLNSIDDLFRDLVLDDRSAFDRALEVAAEFDNLTAIHAELETARRQQESLVPVASEFQNLEKLRKRVEHLRVLKRILPVWFAITGQQKWQQVLDQMAGERDQVGLRLQEEQRQEADCQARVDTLRERYLELGGNVVGELERTIRIQAERVAERTKQAGEYRRLVAMFELGDELSPQALLRNQAQLGINRAEIQLQRNGQQDTVLATLSRLLDQEMRLDETGTALRKVVERPGSNIPPPFQDFRAELAAVLKMTEDDLPFLAELVEVKAEESAWRGAIERAIGSERLRILVPEASLDAALRWVNLRHNRLHIRLQSGREGEDTAPFFPDGYLRKLNFKSHAMLGPARKLLAGRDLHCVASAEALRNTEHGLTIEGMVSGRQGRFEKQDQKSLSADWMTGFDNKDQVQALTRQIESGRRLLAELNAEAAMHRQRLSGFDQRLAIIDGLLKLEFTAIDLPGATSDLDRSQDRLAALLAPDSDASQARAKHESERADLERLKHGIRKLEAEITVLQKGLKDAGEEQAKCGRRIGRGLSNEELELAGNDLKINAGLEAKELVDAERSGTESLEKNLASQLERVADSEKNLIRLMEIARRVDNGALADFPSEIGSVPEFLRQLQILNEEALPEKRRRFLEYLNRSSDQGVTQLLRQINEEVSAIEQRIRELNQTLLKVDFRSGRYLQLEPQPVRDERLRTLDTAMRKVRSAALKDDEGESHFKALQEMVRILREAGENRRQQGSRALLDPRFRLQFFVVETDRQTGQSSPPRTGSQSGSGGEKELMASHILTASLSYALCPSGASRPLYGTVVLDEAFSKSSPSAAGRIIEALRIFGLHPVFVTPNKEIGLLKQHTRRVICVQRPGREASLASITWEKLETLDERARPR